MLSGGRFAVVVLGLALFALCWRPFGLYEGYFWRASNLLAAKFAKPSRSKSGPDRWI
jgi:hypothetical protein